MLSARVRIVEYVQDVPNQLVFVQALTEYWNNLPEEHKDTLFSMREEDFVAELDAHMKYQLKACMSLLC